MQHMKEPLKDSAGGATVHCNSCNATQEGEPNCVAVTVSPFVRAVFTARSHHHFQTGLFGPARFCQASNQQIAQALHYCTVLYIGQAQTS